MSKQTAMFNISIFSDLKWVLALLDERRKKFYTLTLLSVSLGILDLIGVAIFGIVATIAVRGFQNTELSPRTIDFLNFLHLDQYPIKQVLVILTITGSIFLLLKTLTSIVITSKTQKFLANCGADISNKVANQVLRHNLSQLDRFEKQETRFYITHGPRALMNGICGSYSSLASDLVLLFLMFTALLISSVVTSIATLLFFSLAGWVLHKTQRKRAFDLGSERTTLGIYTEKKLLMLFSSYKELFVQNQVSDELKSLKSGYQELASIDAKMSILPFLGKYFMEIALVVSVLLVLTIQSTLGDISDVVGALAIFLVAASRIAPAILRIQQSLMSIKSNAGSALGLKNLVALGEPETTEDEKRVRNVEEKSYLHTREFQAEICLKNVSFEFKDPKSGKLTPVIQDLNMLIKKGEKIAIVGESGAGKSTLVDLILGLREPTQGEISVSQMKPLEALKKWPGKTIYLPQEVAILDNTVRENVAFGSRIKDIDDEKVRLCLKRVNLMSVINRFADGIYQNLRDSGSGLSGGEKQRLGVARALYAEASLIILDEVTSALDGVNEKQISDEIISIDSDTTVIMIAHRLSTIRSVDRIILMKQGKIVAEGSFEQLRNSSADFEEQIKSVLIE